MLCYYNLRGVYHLKQVFMLPRAPMGRIVSNLCFLPDNVFSVGCIHAGGTCKVMMEFVRKRTKTVHVTQSKLKPFQSRTKITLLLIEIILA